MKKDKQSKYQEIFDACSCVPPNVDAVKLAYERVCERLNKSKVKKVVDRDSGDTPLHVALMHGADRELVEYLISTDKGMVKQPNFRMLLPIHLACNGENSSLEVVRLLTELWTGSLKKCTGMGNLPLHVACVSRAPLSVVRYLTEQSERAKRTLNRKKQTPLDCAMSEDKGRAILPDVVEFLGEENLEKDQQGAFSSFRKKLGNTISIRFDRHSSKQLKH